ncbi:LysR family transcriptional regulator [Longispora albida]|uniref:LysR family transcriptional regulator n=1 Tax=Longispora albida TaxID=203523 RepID=UPI000379590E|nr:LysR family transcriptional regulator [Longispora albida]
MERTPEITLPAVRAFAAVAAAGSFRAAARELGVSQPTLSAAVRRFEDSAGQQLLHRERDGVRLTEHGRRVLPHATALVSAADDLGSLLAGRDAAPLTIGFLGEAAASDTRRVLEVIERESGRELRLRRYDFDDPSCGLLSGASDLAIVWPPLGGDEALAVLPLSTDQRAIALPAGHPLAARHTIEPSDLAGQRWLVPGTPDRRYQAFRHPGHLGITDIAGVTECASIEEILELAAAGQGLALSSLSTGEHYARSGLTFVPLPPAHRCGIALAWRVSDSRPMLNRIAGALGPGR